ncbi:Chitinase 2 [Chamberlinius hualienensis]
MKSDMNDRRVVCYYGSWAVYRPDLGKFDVEDIDPYICTHVIYAFAGLNPSTDEIQSLDPFNDLYDNYGKGAFERFTKLSEINPDLKCILGIGGWNEGSTKYSDMANDPSRRAKFVQSVVPFLKKYGFHGLDMDWEYPTQRGGRPSDRQAYIDLLKELKAAFEPEGFLLSAAVSAGKDTIDAAYDVPEVSKYLDFINVMAYDFHGTWESFTGHNAPLRPRPEETSYQQMMNVEFAANYWLQLGAPAEKINLGMPTYGHNFALADPNNHGFYAPTWGPGEAGPYTRQAGTLGYNEICVDLQEGGWTVEFDEYYQAPYAYKGNQWVGYDDPDSIAEKCKLANQLGFGGAMIWSIETDDFQPTCGNQKFVLLRVINEYIRGISSNVTAPPPPPPPTTTPYTGPPTTAAPTQAPTQAPTPPPPPPSDVCQYSGFQADPNDCTTFYNCIPNANGSWDVYTFHCVDGNVFDPAIDSCNYAASVPDCHANI